MTPRRSRRLAVLAALIAIAPALVIALRTVAGLRWPHDQDLFRDLAQAQAFADGFFADPFYAGERPWYNPLLPALFALVARLTGLAVATVSTQAGPWLGLAGIAAFAVLVRRLTDTWTAALATIHLVLLRDPDRPGWTSAGPTPWAFASSAAQALAWMALLALRNAWLRPSWARAAVAGLALGLAFLGHTAAALVPVAVFGIAVLLHAGRARTRVLPFVLAAVACLLASAPFLLSILGRYHAHVVNPAPIAWAFEPRPPLPENDLLRFARMALLVPAFFALVLLARRATRRFDAALAGALLVGPLLLSGVPMPVPAFHFVAYAEAGVSLLAAWGLVHLAASARRGFLPLVLLASATMSAIAWPTLPRRIDVMWGRQRALEMQDRASWQRMRELLRERTPRRSTVLASDELGLFVVAPAGNTTVAVEPVFSNPYLDYGPRAAGRERLWASLRDGDGGAFAAEAARWNVRYVLASRSERPWVAHAGGALTPVEEAGGLALYAVR